MTTSFINSLHTTQDRQQAVDALRMIESQIESSRRAIDPSSLPVVVAASFGREFDTLQEKSVTEKRLFIQSKIKELIQLKTVRLTLAISPSMSMVERLHRSLHTAFNTPLCLEIVLDPSIIGGLKISLDGEEKAWTVASQIDELFAKEHV